MNLAEIQANLSLEWRLSSAMAFGLTTISPLQRALCRVAEGRRLKELAADSAIIKAFGGKLPPVCKPRELAVLSGIRVGKSLFAGCLAVHWTQTCDVSRLGPGEVPRVSIVSLTKDLANVIFGHVVGRVQASKLLSSLLLEEPSTDTVVLRHPSGRPVEIRVVAGSRAGSSLTARWSAGCIFDEFPRMVGGDEGVINWDDSRKSVLLRLLPGAQMAHIGSPWAPEGPAYELVQKRFGVPGPDLIVVKAPAYDMNPHYWTPHAVEEARANPDIFRTDVLAEFSTPEEALFPTDALTSAVAPESGPEPGLTYAAAMDPATRGNGWTLGVFTRQGTRKRMVRAVEWVGSRNEPLSPRQVLRDVAAVLQPYGVLVVETDQYYIDALQDIAREVGLSLAQVPLTSHEKSERYMAVRAKLLLGEIEIPAVVRTDLARVRKRVTQSGIQILLPLSSDGRHCDYAPVVMLGIGRFLKDEAPPPKKQEDIELKRMLDAATQRYARPKMDDPFD